MSCLGTPTRPCKVDLIASTTAIVLVCPPCFMMGRKTDRCPPTRTMPSWIVEASLADPRSKAKSALLNVCCVNARRWNPVCALDDARRTVSGSQCSEGAKDDSETFRGLLEKMRIADLNWLEKEEGDGIAPFRGI